MQTKTKNVNKTCVLQQTTGGKDEQNIVIMQKSYRTSQHGTQNVKTHNRTTQHGTQNVKTHTRTTKHGTKNVETHNRTSQHGTQNAKTHNRTTQHGTQNVKTHNRTIHKVKAMSNMDTTKKNESEHIAMFNFHSNHY
jgi:hypothetical protein